MTIPKPFRLLIPRKTQKPVAQPDYGTDMRAIEIWAQALVAYVDSIAGGGFTPYASLTGAGETTTPGTLTQQGDFHVANGEFTVADSTFLANGNITLQSLNNGNDISISQPSFSAGLNSISFAYITGIDIEAGGITINTSGGRRMLFEEGGTIVMTVGQTGGGFPGLSFWNAGAIAQPTITGSRGGNAALADLLTALASYGLIVDSTT